MRRCKSPPARGDAEQGLTGGASTTVVTKSGTNELHGSAFWFHDNQHLRARNFFSPTKPVSNYNNFGGTIGGPIKKNKLFYFFGYDKVTQRVAGVHTSDEVPTVDQRAGDFSAYSSVIYDPMTGNPDGTGRTPFANNAIPLSRQSAIARNVQTYYPLPNAPGTQNNYLSAGAPPFARQQIDPKINWNVTDKWQLWGKYANMNAPVSGNAIFGVAGGPAPGGDPGNGKTKVRSVVSATPTPFRRTCSMTALLVSGARSSRSRRRASAPTSTSAFRASAGRMSASRASRTSTPVIPVSALLVGNRCSATSGTGRRAKLHLDQERPPVPDGLRHDLPVARPLAA
ncbi:MAG: hypothetical protein R2748_07835 [Bryobacterales bacterium]